MEERLHESTKVTVKSIVMNIILASIKVVAGMIGNSNAMIADGIHSASDIVTSVGVLFGNIIARKPNDEEHNYGHEKAETLVAFVLSLVLLVVGIEIGFNSSKLLFNLKGVKTPTFIPLIAATLSILVKEYQYYITMKVAKQINSPSLKADAWHHRSDSLSSIGTLVGIGGAMLGFKAMDPIAGLIVSLLVVKVAIDILKTAANELMDYSINKEEEKILRQLVLSAEGVRTITSLKSRRHGSMAYIDLAICVDPNITVYEGHKIAHKVEDKIKENIENIKGVVVHIDACTKICKIRDESKKDVDF